MPRLRHAGRTASLPDPKDKIEEQNLLHAAMMASDDTRTDEARQRPGKSAATRSQIAYGAAPTGRAGAASRRIREGGGTSEAGQRGPSRGRDCCVLRRAGTGKDRRLGRRPRRPGGQPEAYSRDSSPHDCCWARSISASKIRRTPKTSLKRRCCRSLKVRRHNKVWPRRRR